MTINEVSKWFRTAQIFQSAKNMIFCARKVAKKRKNVGKRLVTGYLINLKIKKTMNLVYSHRFFFRKFNKIWLSSVKKARKKSKKTQNYAKIGLVRK